MTTEDRPMADGIFGSGIDLSALDEQTAWRLGVFFGEQILAAEECGRQRGRAAAIADLRDDELIKLATETALKVAADFVTGQSNISPTEAALVDAILACVATYLEAKGHQP